MKRFKVSHFPVRYLVGFEILHGSVSIQTHACEYSYIFTFVRHSESNQMKSKPKRSNFFAAIASTSHAILEFGGTERRWET